MKSTFGFITKHYEFWAIITFVLFLIGWVSSTYFIKNLLVVLSPIFAFLSLYIVFNLIVIWRRHSPSVKEERENG